MELRESLQLSLRAIREHGLRSALTVVGITIGIAAVIVFVTLGASLQTAVIGEVSGDAPPEMQVTVGPEGQQGPPGTSTVPAFTERDVDEIESLQDVDRVVPQGTVQTSTLQHEGRSIAWESATATSPAFFEDNEFASGGPFEQGATEVVINSEAASLFDPELEVGDTLGLRVGQNTTREATVVGIVESTGSSPFGDISIPQVYVPTDPFYGTTAESPATGENQRVYPSLTVVAEDYEAVPSVQSAVETYLEDESDARTLKPTEYEFSVQTNEELVDQIREVISTFTGFVAGIAVISLIVGAVGIANIMLVSVTERTREIGIMKAVGARRRDVLQLFLVEAVALGIAGAVLGTLVGLAGGYAATSYLDLPLTFAPEWFAAAVLVGVGVGVVAGLYPAWNAARVDPIEALRRE
ncbi:putative ABC transport system permease protein [Natronoarchaeum philippinense]|uniref:Putative ABC transport system permease protein n=1 Tax=Natronoarchaeum philippinense TaxID=558529 RepID=A0A285N938_NATPI|nr:ABC transporter permease [Natronoarchaeum philippinense]SNZ06002.1 putative ABC transport system permease protein [Natronoarchaeum philippinense]